MCARPVPSTRRTGPPGPATPATPATTPGADPADPAADGAPVRRFAALRHRSSGPYLVGGMLSMMADNIEHVITYWVLWERYHSPLLAGFQVISHWLPFLLLSVWFGSLADRYDCRRVIQAAQLLFLAVSGVWGILLATDRLSMPAACMLLVAHGMAGALWGPAEQLLLQDMVGRRDVGSAVRLNSTFKGLGILVGPVVGSALLTGLGPAAGLWANMLFYLPLTLTLLRTPFTGHVRDGAIPARRVGLWQSYGVLRDVAADRILLAMIVITGLTSLFIGSSLQSVMPEFAAALGPGDTDRTYAVLLFANGAGGVLAGLALEATGRVRSTVRVAVISTLAYAATMAGFAVVGGLAAGIALLVAGGVAALVSMSVTQTVAQLRAPADRRGAVMGVYSVASGGLKVGSGITVGLLSGAAGVHWSLGGSAAALGLGTLAAAGWTHRPARGRQAPRQAPR